MAAPKLKTAAPAGAPRRVLLNTGTVPTKRVTLLGANGQSIAPKATPAPAPEPAPAPLPEQDAAAQAAAAEAAAQAAAAEAAAQAEAEARAAAEAQAAAEAAAKAEAEAAAAQAAAEEEARKAQEEYERQMAEYNRQMEEYNRQMAEYEAQQAAAAQETAPVVQAPTPTPAPKPMAGPRLNVAKPAGAPAAGPKLTVAKPAGAPTAGPKLSVAKPAAAPTAGPKLAPAQPAAAPTAGPKQPSAKPAVTPGAPKPALAPKASVPPAPAPVPPAPALPDDVPPPPVVEDEPQLSEAEMAARSDYLEKLQYEAAKVPFHKKPIFWVATGVLAVGAIAALIYGQMSQSAVDAVELDRAKIGEVLNRSIAITQQEIETLDDAKSKGVNVKCTVEEAELLLHIILNHDERDEFGGPRYGSDSVGVAKNACVLLGLASEQNSKICNMVFKTLAENSTKMHHELLDLLLERLVKTNIKGLNKKLDALAKTLKPGKDDEVLAVIWKYKELRATTKDVPKVIELLKLKKLDKELENTLRAYMVSLFKKTAEADTKKDIGEQIFDAVSSNKERMDSQNLMRIFGFACSPKALEYYKEKMKDQANWNKYGYFFGSWQSDDVVPYLAELRDSCTDEKKQRTIDSVIMRVLTQDRERDADAARTLLRTAFNDFDAPTTDYAEILEKCDGENPLKEGDAGYEEAHARFAELKNLFKQRDRLLENLKNCSEHEWIEAILSDLEKDCAAANSPEHRRLANKITKVRKEIKENTINRANSAAKHESRLQNE